MGIITVMMICQEKKTKIKLPIGDINYYFCQILTIRILLIIIYRRI